LEQGIVGDEFKIKKYFYVLRSLLSAKWIIDKNEVAPMEFHILMQQVEAHTELVDAVNILLEKKRSQWKVQRHRFNLSFIILSKRNSKDVKN